MDWDIEYQKCKNSPYYFYTNYFLIDGKPATTCLTEAEFNEQFELMQMWNPKRYFKYIFRNARRPLIFFKSK